MATQAQIDANRRNSQKSTGPRTPEGKAAVSRNALKHGFRARDVVLPGEDPDGEFPLMLEELTAEWQPDTLTDRTLVEDLAAVLWRQQRAARIEQGTLIAAGEVATDKIWGRPTPPDPSQHHEIGTRILAEAYAIAAEPLDRIHRHQDRLDRSQARLLRQLESRQAARTKRSNPIDPASPSLHENLAQIERSNPISIESVRERSNPIDSASPSPNKNLTEIGRSNPISTESVGDRPNPIDAAKMGTDIFSLKSPEPDQQSNGEKAVCPRFSPASPSLNRNLAKTERSNPISPASPSHPNPRH